MDNYDFSGWATRNDLLCADGRTIRRNAFKECDGQSVPLVWNHDHKNQDAVLGHALLENREDGVYAYCKFNDTEQGQHAKQLVEHGDVRSLSIYANKLKQIGNDVIHRPNRALSPELSGHNTDAFIAVLKAQGEDEEDSFIANYDENAIIIYHSEISSEETVSENSKEEAIEHSEESKENPKMEEEKKDEKSEEKTVKDVVDSMTDEQR